MNTSRDLWVPQFETRVIELLGHDWPDVLVEKWEVNGLGERRFVSSKLYSAARFQQNPDVTWTDRTMYYPATGSATIRCTCPPDRGDNYAGSCPIHDIRVLS